MSIILSLKIGMKEKSVTLRTKNPHDKRQKGRDGGNTKHIIKPK